MEVALLTGKDMLHTVAASCGLVRVAGPPRIYFCRPIRHNAAL